MGRRRRALLLSVLLLFSGCLSVAPEREPAADGRTATVVRVVDGDTLDVEFANGSRETIRLLGVDTPEVHAPNDPREFGYANDSASRRWLREWGHRASEFAREEVAGERVTVIVDPEAERRDRYGRLLAFVERDGDDLGERLLARGYARFYADEFARRDDYAAAERRARERGTGLWGFEDGRGM